MAPENSRPETQTGSDKFVDGLHPTDRVRSFNEEKGALADPAIHEPLFERGVPDVNTIDPDTLDIATIDKIPFDPLPTPEQPVETPEAEQPTSKWKKLRIGLGVASGAAAIAVTGAFVGSAMSNDDSTPQPDQPREQVGAPVAPGPESQTGGAGEPEPGSPEQAPSSIEGANKPSSIEQITFLSENPVSIKDFPDAADALMELSKYANILYLADPDTTPRDLTVRAYEAIYDTASPYYESSVVEMDNRRTVLSGQFGIHGDTLESSLSLVPTGAAVSESANGSVVNADILYSGNVLNFMGANLETTKDYNANFVLSSDDGNWRIYSANDVRDLGDVG